MNPAQFFAVEAVGGCFRIPALKKAVATELGLDLASHNFGLSLTMNADEGIAAGAALQCAMLSHHFKVKPFTVLDKVEYAVRLQWLESESALGAAAAEGGAADMDVEGDEKKGDEAEEAAAGAGNEIIMFTKDMTYPVTKRICFKRNEQFYVEAVYANEGEVFGEQQLAKFIVDGMPEGAEDGEKVRVNVRMTGDGCVELSSAEYMKLKVEEPEPVKAPEAKGPAAEDELDEDDGKSQAGGEGDAAEGDAAADGKEGEAAAEGGADAAAADGKEGEAAAAEGDAAADDGKDDEPPPVTAGGADAAAAAATETEEVTDGKAGGEGKKKKRKFRRMDLDVNVERNEVLSGDSLMQAVEEEAKMAQQDRIIRETAEARNDLESYCYRMRDAMDSELKEYVNPDEKAAFGAKLQETDDWIYSDEGFSAKKKDFAEKMQVRTSFLRKRRENERKAYELGRTWENEREERVGWRVG